MKRWRCVICGYLHDGDAPPFRCPVCGAPKTMFERLDDESAASGSPPARRPAGGLR